MAAWVPWLFAELSGGFHRQPGPHSPLHTLGEVADIIRPSRRPCWPHTSARTWQAISASTSPGIFHGFPAGPRSGVSNGQDVRRARLPLDRLDGTVPFPTPRLARSRLRPFHGYNDPDDCRVPEGADAMGSGG